VKLRVPSALQLELLPNKANRGLLPLPPDALLQGSSPAPCARRFAAAQRAAPVDAQRAAADLHPVVDEVVGQGPRVGQVAAALQGPGAGKAGLGSSHEGRRVPTLVDPLWGGKTMRGQRQSSWPAVLASILGRVPTHAWLDAHTPHSITGWGRRRTSRSAGLGAVKGWCSASSRPSSAFHSNMGKSTTHSRLCCPSCAG
jgi:hypothetical protein